MTNVQPTVQATGLTKRFPTVTALDSLNLTLPAGRIVGLLGENGSGKTTLMKIIAGVTDTYEGEARICGFTPGAQSKAVTSYLPDKPFLNPRWTVRYCIDLYADFFPDFSRDKAADMLAYFGLAETSRLREMSKGMREKVQIALVMSRNAKLFLLDEPISGVDPAARDVILQSFLRNLEDDATLMISTHLIHDLEPILDTVVMMRHGKVIVNAEADDLRAQYGQSMDQIFREIYR